METLKGYVDHIVYQNSENGYTVLSLRADGEEVTCVGMLPAISEGELIEASGQYTVHASYGQQFRIESYEIREPEDTVAVERYLGSGAIKGIGSALAARIVRRFGADTLRIIDREPERLAEVKGISRRGAMEIAAQMEEKRELREAMIFLGKFGISTAMSVKIYRRYGNQIYHVIRENPYRLADDVQGIGFRIADEIAKKAGIAADSDFRVRSGIFYVLQQASAEGHTYLPEELLEERTKTLLGVDIPDLDRFLTDMAVEKKIVVKREEEEVRVYASSLYYLEADSARMFHELNVTAPVDLEKLREQIARIERRTKTSLDPIQVQAVTEAVRCGLMVLTGGPGTGKTTTINTMIELFSQEGKTIALAAPTGRAAKRMTEATGYEARTIHRLLEVEGGPDQTVSGFGRDASNPLDADVIIVDEMSMVDIFLMHALLEAIVPGTRLVLVGDVNQLPSVGPGCVLKDLIGSGICSVVRLTRIFRQAGESDIVVNAHRINRGEHPVLDNKSRDFFFLQRYDADRIIPIVLSLVAKKLPPYVKARPEDIQVLTPTRKGLLGVERLNNIMQSALNPAERGRAEYVHGDRVFRRGDKVMQIKNNYQLEWEVRGRYGIPIEKGTGIFNGDMGTILEISTAAETMSVEFDENRVVEYPFSGLDELEHAWAVTIHKSQGSEYPAVVIPLLGGPRMLMNRNLIYTAITRAKNCVVLVGDPEVFFGMIDNTLQQRRYSGLQRRLQDIGLLRE